jgi:hypothetical protein
VRAGRTLAEFATTPDAADSGFLDIRALVGQLAKFRPYTNEASTLRHRYLEDSVGDEGTLLTRAVSIADPLTRSLVLAALCGELSSEFAGAARAEAIAAAQSVGDQLTAAALRRDLIALMAERGHQAEALRIALADEDALYRTETLIALARYVTDNVAADARHKAIADFASALQRPERLALAGDLAAWLAAAGELEGVRTLAAAASNGIQRQRILARAASYSSDAEDLLWAELDSLEGNAWVTGVTESAHVLSVERCRKVITRIGRPEHAGDRDIVLASVAARLTVLGADSDARSLLLRIDDDAWRELTAVDLAASFAARKDARGTLEIAVSIRRLAWRIRATAPALGLLEPTDRTAAVDELLALAAAAGDAQPSGHLRCLLLPMTETATRQRIAADVIVQLPHVGDGAALACDLAVALASAGDHDEALTRAAAIEDSHWRAEALARIAPLLDSLDSASGILATARALTSTDARLAIFAGLARPLAAAPALARHEVWNEMLNLLATSTRREIAEYRGWLRAAFGDLATDDGISAAIVASEQVFRWWP